MVNIIHVQMDGKRYFIMQRQEFIRLPLPRSGSAGISPLRAVMQRTACPGILVTAADAPIPRGRNSSQRTGPSLHERQCLKKGFGLDGSLLTISLNVTGW